MYREAFLKHVASSNFDKFNVINYMTFFQLYACILDDVANTEKC